jgi:hypothetical protein
MGARAAGPVPDRSWARRRDPSGDQRRLGLPDCLPLEVCDEGIRSILFHVLTGTGC